MKEKLVDLRSNPTGTVIWIVLTCGSYILFMGGQYRELYTPKERMPWVIMALVFVLIAHEMVHAIVALVLTRKKVQIKVAKDPIGLPTLGTFYTDNIGKCGKLAIHIAPFITLTIIGQPVYCLGHS